MLGRILAIFFSLIVAIMIAGIVLAVGILVPDRSWLDADPVERVMFFTVSFFATSFIGASAFVPALLLIVVAEIMRLRTLLYYAAAGAVVGLTSYYGSNVELRLENTTDVSPVFHPLQLAAAAGIIGGLAYWLLAGRNAGRWREPAQPPA
jgi:H+/Cl- antiporter ClcA